MLIYPISSNNAGFCHNLDKKFNFKLSKETIKAFETSTGLTYEEMT